MSDPKTDYNQVAQEYAKNAILAAFTLNGGAIVLVLSQISELSIENVILFKQGILFWVFGLMVSVFTWITGFASSRYMAKEKGIPADFWMWFGIICFVSTIALFFFGTSNVLDSLQLSANKAIS